MSEIAMSISCVIDGEPKAFLLENIEDIPITSSSTISRHPVPNGYYVSDTMYKEPTIVNVNGTFSMNGKKGIVMDGSGNMTLENIENFFEKIRKEGILCNLVKVKITDNNSPQFSVRKNMALQSIGWNERINSLGFGFTFQEIMQVNISEYEVDRSDPNLPDVEDPQTLNFTESLFEPQKVLQMLVSVLNENGLLEEGFIDKFCSWDLESLSSKLGKELGWDSATIAEVHGLAFFAVAAIGLALIMSSLAAVAIAAAIGFLIYKIVKSSIDSSKYKVDKFKVYNNDEKMEKQIVRFLELLTNILKELEKLNQQIVVYQISSNKPHQAILSVDDNYYCFTFNRNNDDNSYSLTVLDLDGAIVRNSTSISCVRTGAKQSIDECNNTTTILKTGTGTQVFLLNPNENRSDALTENFILVSNIDMGNFSKVISDVIKTYIFY